ncbi:MAG: hypothetical protein ACTSUF_10335 [Candidatus Heimdallarchaeaceae archaeon]
MNSQKTFEDSRGTIRVFYDNDEELKVITTYQGKARGGCLHDCDEVFEVVSGDVLLVAGNSLCLKAGKSCVIQAFTHHWFISLTDSVVIERIRRKSNSRKDEKIRDFIKKINGTQDIK